MFPFTIALGAIFLSFSALEINPAQSSTPPQITLRSDIQEENTQTNIITARGNVLFDYPDAQIRGLSEEAQYLKEKQIVILIGNVRLLQRGEEFKGEKFTCAIAQKNCVPDN
jgi:lipopolysaccharide export system protein LptA